MTADPAAGGARTAAVVVNYRAGPALAGCVGSLQGQGLTEVVVVDNGSADGSVDGLRRAWPATTVLAPGANLGFGAGANRGVAATTSEFVLVCNPDLTVGAGAVAALVAALDAEPAAAVAGPLVRTATGDRYPSARRFPSLVDAAGHGLLGLFLPDNRFTRAYHLAGQVDGDGPGPVDWVSGACLLARRTAFEAVGGFDESFFMYAEDVDLCWRLGRAGWAVLYAPGAEVVHHQGVSTAGRPYRMILEHHRSLLRFAGRSTRGWRRLLLPVVAAGVAVRAGLACLRQVTAS